VWRIRSWIKQFKRSKPQSRGATNCANQCWNFRPWKLADCSSRDASESEIFIVEGIRAEVPQGRDRGFQAILPCAVRFSTLKTDTEIQALITALGLGVKGDEFDASQLRYHRICLMTDADVDGAHIRTLLLTFFYRYQRSLIEEGYVYIACPPLYKVERGRNHYYCCDRELKFGSKRFPSNANYTAAVQGLGK